MNNFLDEKMVINKMDELSNERWQQIKLHFPPSITNFPYLYLKLHLLHLYYLAESFLPLPHLCMNLSTKCRWENIIIIYIIQKSFNKRYFNHSNNIIGKQLL
jgi:hypothetical protein